jgi:hypothetical protein
MPWALSYKAAPVHCASPGHCLGAGVTSSLIPILLRMGVGVLAGAIVGAFLCLALPGLGRRNF